MQTSEKHFVSVYWGSQFFVECVFMCPFTIGCFRWVFLNHSHWVITSNNLDMLIIIYINLQRFTQGESNHPQNHNFETCFAYCKFVCGSPRWDKRRFSYFSTTASTWPRATDKAFSPRSSCEPGANTNLKNCIFLLVLSLSKHILASQADETPAAFPVTGQSSHVQGFEGFRSKGIHINTSGKPKVQVTLFKELTIFSHICSTQNNTNTLLIQQIEIQQPEEEKHLSRPP